MRSTSWMDRGACRGTGLDLFYPGDHERQPQRDAREAAAKSVCADCPVHNACLDYAIERGDKDGIWGGLNEDERASERRRRMRRAA